MKVRPLSPAVPVVCLFLLAAACAPDAGPGDDIAGTEQRSSELVQTCTATNVTGNPYKGRLCGGAFIDNCTPGLVYSCRGGARGTTGNCTLDTTCSVACLTGAGDTPVTANIGTATPVANDACFNGPAPLTFSTNSTTGGSYVTMTGTLTQPHSPYAIVNFKGTTADVPPLCSPPLFLFPNTNSVSWIEPTNVVAAPKTVPLWALISFNDSTGAGRNLVSVTNPLTLNPGATVPSPPWTSFAAPDATGPPLSTTPGGTNDSANGPLPAPTQALERRELAGLWADQRGKDLRRQARDLLRMHGFAGLHGNRRRTAGFAERLFHHLHQRGRLPGFRYGRRGRLLEQHVGERAIDHQPQRERLGVAFVAGHLSVERFLRLLGHGNRHAYRPRTRGRRSGRALLEQHGQRAGSRQRDGGCGTDPGELHRDHGSEMQRILGRDHGDVRRGFATERALLQLSERVRLRVGVEIEIVTPALAGRLARREHPLGHGRVRVLRGRAFGLDIPEQVRRGDGD